MKISYDPAKRELVLIHRGLDLEDAAEAFAGPHFDRVDDRSDYGEVRWQTVGLIQSVVVVIVWTQRGDTRRIITMWKASENERSSYARKMD